MSTNPQSSQMEDIVSTMTDFEKSVYNDICAWTKSKFGECTNASENFVHFRELYWKEYLNSQKNSKIKNIT